MPARRVTILVALALSACGREPKSAPTTPTPLFESPSAVPEGLRRAADAFALRLQIDFAGGDVPGVLAAFDLAAVADDVCDGLGIPIKQLAGFKRGFQDATRRSLENQFRSLANRGPKFKGVVIVDGRLGIRFRFTALESGITLIDFVLRKSGSGDLAIVDFFNRSLDVGLVALVRQSTLSWVGTLDHGVFERLFGSSDGTPADFEIVGEMAKKMQAGEFAEAAAIYRRLPPSVQRLDGVTAMNLVALQRSGDDEGYKAALRSEAMKSRSPGAQLKLVDLYYLEGDHARAIECLDRFMEAVEVDAALLAQKACLQNNLRQTAAARATLLAALSLESDCEFAHAKGLDVFLAARDFAGARESMEFLEEQCDYSFDDLTDPIWKEFLESPESLAWR